MAQSGGSRILHSPTSPPTVQRSDRRRLSRKIKRKKNKHQSIQRPVDDSEISYFYEEEDEDEEQRLLDTFANLFNNESLSDVHFVVGSKDRKRIPAHRLILSVRSEVFERMLNGPMKEGSSNIDIDVPDIEPSDFLTLLKFVYTAKIDLSPETAMGTLYAAKKYGVPGLRQACLKYLKNSLTIRNASMMFAQAQLFDERGLEKHCLEVIERNSKEILNSPGFREIPAESLKTIIGSDKLRVREIFIFRACIRWAESECKRQRLEIDFENKRQVLKDIIPLLRFPLISLEEIAEEVVESGILKKKELVQLFSYLCSRKNPPEIRFSIKPRVRFLVIGTDWAAEVRHLIVSRCPVASVDAVNPNVDQISLVLCEQYDGILVFSSSAFSQPDELGDILADYVDGGGGVVIGAIAGDSDSHGISGRFERDDYMALKRGERSHDSRHVLGKRILPDHPILENIQSFDGGPQSWRVKSVIGNNSKLIAEWEDGVPLVAEKPIRERYCSVSLNLWPPSRNISKDGWETYTDGDKFLVNSLLYVANA